MRNVFSLGRLAGMLLVALASAPTGCSSIEALRNDAGAQGGGSGQTGSGGAPGADAGAGATCQSLIADYASAFDAARTCSPFVAIAQCTHLASASLQCPNCPVHVNDTTRLDEVRAAFAARTDCPALPCPAILCVNPGSSGACMAHDSGSAGSCVDVR